MDTNTEVNSLDNPSDQLSVGYDDDDVFLVVLHSAGDRMVSMEPDEAYSLAVLLEWLTDPIERDCPNLWPPRRAMAALFADKDNVRSVSVVIANEDDAEVVAVRLTLDDTNKVAEALFRACVETAWLDGEFL